MNPRFHYLSIVVLLYACNQKPTESSSQAETDLFQPPERYEVVSGDSANRIYFWDAESTIRVEGEGDTVHTDGLMLLEIENATVPFKLRSSLMDIDVLELPLLLRIDAFDNQAGQSLELYAGALRVQKTYTSPFPSIDTLHAGDLYMINSDIDLSEKEQLDDLLFLEWWQSYHTADF